MIGNSTEQNEPSGGYGPAMRIRQCGRWLRQFVRDRSANVFITFAIVAPLLLVLIGAGLDYSYAENTKRTLQDATDAATLAVAAAVTKNPNSTTQQLKVVAQTVLDADFPNLPTPILTDFHVCAAVQNDCAAKTGTMTMNTIMVAAQAQAPCALGGLLPIVCNVANNTAQNISSTTTTVIGFGSTLQLNVVMDSSASMIVGATTNDVNLISAWMDYSVTTPVYTTQPVYTRPSPIYTTPVRPPWQKLPAGPDRHSTSPDRHPAGADRHDHQLPKLERDGAERPGSGVQRR